MNNNIYITVSLILILGFVIGKLLRKMGLTEVLAYLIAGIIIGPVLKIDIPDIFDKIITGITLAFVGYNVGMTFSRKFLQKMGRKVIIILVVEVVATSLVVFIFVYLLTKNLAISVILASLAPATAPAGTLAVFRDMRAKGTLTDVSIAIVGLDDAASILVYSVGIILAKVLLGSNIGLMQMIYQPLYEVFGAIILGFIIGIIIAYITLKIRMSQDQIFIMSIALILLTWGIAESIKVSSIMACMVFGATIINSHLNIAIRSNKLIDGIMAPIFVLFFAAIGTEVEFSKISAIWILIIVYVLGRSVGKVVGCRLGGVLSNSESKIKRYLGIALLNQAGVAVGLAFLAAQELSSYGLGATIITLMAATTTVFQILSPLGTQYAVKKSGEGSL